MKIERERFEVVARRNPNEDDNKAWAEPHSARVKKGTPGREGRPGGDWQSKTMDNAVFYQSIPPGSDIDDQEMADIRKRKMWNVPGDPHYNQITHHLTVESVKEGFTHLDTPGTDDAFIKTEPPPLFNHIAEVDGDQGFLVRGRPFDRN